MLALLLASKMVCARKVTRNGAYEGLIGGTWNMSFSLSEVCVALLYVQHRYAIVCNWGFKCRTNVT
jgi:hypothetical protein